MAWTGVLVVCCKLCTQPMRARLADSSPPLPLPLTTGPTPPHPPCPTPQDMPDTAMLGGGGSGGRGGMFKSRSMGNLGDLSGGLGWGRGRGRGTDTHLRERCREHTPSCLATCPAARLHRAPARLPGLPRTPHPAHRLWRACCSPATRLPADSFFDEEDEALAALEFSRPRKMSKSMSVGQLAGMEQQAAQQQGLGRPPRECRLRAGLVVGASARARRAERGSARCYSCMLTLPLTIACPASLRPQWPPPLVVATASWDRWDSPSVAPTLSPPAWRCCKRATRRAGGPTTWRAARVPPAVAPPPAGQAPLVLLHRMAWPHTTPAAVREHAVGYGRACGAGSGLGGPDL